MKSKTITKKIEEDTKPENIKTIDIYIIAGQSNASGYTKIDESIIKSLWDKCYVGSKNVIYAGRAESTDNVNTPSVSTIVNEVDWTKARLGQGMSTSHMGAEVGMAKVLSEEYYTGDRVAGIIKFAHGGTSLTGSQGGENAANGNWVSPSYAKFKKLDYSGITGGLYRGLLAQVEKNISELEGMGYNQINIKGVFWMQGESDRDEYGYNYQTALEYFISDLRGALSEITGIDLSELPFMIGEISRTCTSADQDSINLNERFIETQHSVAEKLDKVYIIPSAPYEIVKLDPVTGGEILDPVQRDHYHWNTESIFGIGQLVGRCIIDKILN